MAQQRRRPRIDVVASPPPTKRKSSTDDVEAAAKRRKSIEEFEMLEKIGEGTYGVVYRARDKRSGEIVAVKKVKSEEGKQLAEINILSRLRHPSIVDLKHVAASDGGVLIAMEYAENDVRSVLGTMKQQGFSQSEAKCLMQQLLQGVEYLHRNQVLHRDLKTSNLLLNNRGDLKICDFGIACRFNINNNCVAHREEVVTLLYRAPELLLGAKDYSTAIDMWSVGCVMAELLSGKPLFDGVNEIDQLGKMFKILGSPNEAMWPGFSKLPGVKVAKFTKRSSLLRQRFPAMSFTGLPVLSNAGFNLLTSLLTYDPRMRITAQDALNHPWFREVPLPKSKDFMPTFPPTRKSLSQQQSGTGLFGL